MSVQLIKAAMRSAEIGHLADQIWRLERGGIDALHFDVMDGRFVPELCMGPSFIRGLRQYTKLLFEVHLLVQDPEASLNQYVDAGADCLLWHIEASQHPSAALAHIRSQGCQAGLAIAPATPASVLAPYLGLCDVVNVMTVAPGKPGAVDEGGVQNLIEVAACIRASGGVQVVQADGAVSAAARDRFVEAGARALVVGYPIFSRDDFGQAITGLRNGPCNVQVG